MLKTIFILPDGTEISSGPGTVNAIQSLTLTQWVNDGQDLTVGSACASIAEITLLTPGGGLHMAAGEEITLYRQDESGKRRKVGLFLTEKPTRPSANTMRLTAFDRMILLDKDLSAWLAGLTGWPYRAEELARMVCGQCGLPLKNESLPNGAYKIQKFTADTVTGRTLVKWLGQIAGCFARITADGELEFAWYTPNENASIGPTPVPGSNIQAVYGEEDLALTDENLSPNHADRALTLSSQQIAGELTGENLQLELLSYNAQHYYYQQGLTFEDYSVAPVEQVRIRQTADDVGCAYPAEAPADANTYTLTGNLLLTTTNAASLEPVASHLHARLASLSYTPCKVTIPANMVIRAGDILRVLDRNGKYLTMYVMKKTQTGQRETLECTGNPRRDSASALGEQSLSGLSGKVLSLKLDLEGLKLENRENDEKAAKLALDVDGLRTQVNHQRSQLEQTDTRLTQLSQSAENVSIEVKRILQEGVSRVETATGYTFGSEGLFIRKSGEEMENRLDNTGMYVTRSNQTILQANSAGVEAADVTVRNYLRLGDHARLEDYSGGRTACFYI